MSEPCAHRGDGRYCPDCGKDLRPAPFDQRTIFDDVAENWWEKGAIQTFIGLFREPGPLIRRYIEEDRDLLVKPVAYVAVVLALNYLVRARLLPGSDTTDLTLIEMLRNEPVILPLVSAMISALVLNYVFYRHASAGLFGTIIMRVYVLAQATLLMLAADLLMELATPDRSIERNLVRAAVGIGYSIAAVRQFYAGEGRGGWIRAIVAVVCGEIALILLVLTPAAMIERSGFL